MLRPIMPLLAVVAALGATASCDGKPQLAVIAHGGSGPPTLVLLHGYGSSASQWVPFTKTIQLPPDGRFVFPDAPEATVPPDGPTGGRGWWPLRLRAHIPPGGRVPDLSGTRPPGLKIAASQVQDLLGFLRRSPGGPIVLGGYSQGAMVASEVAFQSDVPLAALVLLSGTAVDEASWERNFSRRQGLRVFISHGRIDTVLPFNVSDRMRMKLESAGVNVTWVPFDGGHEIPAEVVVALNEFLNGLSFAH